MIIRGNFYKFCIKTEGYITLLRATLYLLNHFVEKPFCRSVILSNVHFVEYFKEILYAGSASIIYLLVI